MASQVQSSGAIDYLGEHPRVVDASHRLLLPIEWRPKGAPTRFTLLLWPIDTPEYILALPPARWEMFLKQFEQLPLSDDESAELERLIGLRAFRTSLDQVGRLPLPDTAAKTVGIEGAAHLIGRINKFEICKPQTVTGLLEKPDTKRLSQTLKQIRI